MAKKSLSGGSHIEAKPKKLVRGQDSTQSMPRLLATLLVKGIVVKDVK